MVVFFILFFVISLIKTIKYWLKRLIFFLAGVRFTSYHGNFMLRSTDLLALPAVDCDKAYAAQLSLDETLLTTQTVYFQVALLYPCLIIFIIYFK